MELNSIRTNKHISVASSEGAGNNGRYYEYSVSVWDDGCGLGTKHGITQIVFNWSLVTMDSPDIGAGVRTNIGRAGAHGNSGQTSRHLGGWKLFFRLFGFATFAMQMGYTFSDFEKLKSFHPIWLASSSCPFRMLSLGSKNSFRMDLYLVISRAK